MINITNNSLIKKLLLLNLPKDDYAVFGSGPMFAHGIKELRDVDLIARGKAWEKAERIGRVEKAKIRGGKVVYVDNEIEIFNFWGPGKWDIDDLIDSAEIFEGIRFVKLGNVLKWKRLIARPKDFEHIKMIEKFMKDEK